MSGKAGGFRLETFEGDAVRNREPELLALCAAIFPDFSPAYLSGRLPHIDDPALLTARSEAGALAAFKLGYRRGAALFYSWLGGVHPDARRQGLAIRLMAEQHAWARGKSYSAIETRTRAANAPMIILNLKSGFRIAGFEIDRAGEPIVTQRLDLKAT